MKSTSRFISATLCFMFASAVAQAQSLEAPLLSPVRCQQIDSAQISAPAFTVENFDPKSQAYILCTTDEGAEGPDEFFAGTVPLTGGGKLSLSDFKNWVSNPSGSDLFLTTDDGNHPIIGFETSILPIDIPAVDAILGYPHSRPVSQQICSTEQSASTQCSTQSVEECKIVYGRKECKMVDKEVCSTVYKPVKSCRDETVLGYYRTLYELEGYASIKPSDYCKYGYIERQSKTVYGRVFNERRCCESKVVDGAIKNVCTVWEAY